MPITKKLLIPLAAVFAVLAFAAPSAFASSSQVTMMESDAAVAKSPVATLTKMKEMGVTTVKYSVDWGYVAPSANSTKTPAGLTAASYVPYFGQLVQIDQAAQQVGINLMFLVSSPVPRWAETSTAGCNAHQVSAYDVCRPDPAKFQTFVEALGAEFSGKVAGVPAVKQWSIWNEPNYITNLAPQLSGSTQTAAVLYRGLADAAYAGLVATGHKSDKILFGDLAPRGIANKNPATGAGVKPVAFLASLYCTNTAGKRLTGASAKAYGCPSSAAAFRSQNPVLFNASGIADHPYGQGVPPTQKTADCVVKGVPTFCIPTKSSPADPLWTDLASINSLTGGLDKFVKAEGSSKKFPVYNTEYGYWTTPAGSVPCRSASQTNCDLSMTKAAQYLNQAEYISYKNSRIASFDQYQLYMVSGGGWTNGLLKPNGSPEPTYAAWEAPLWMPTTTLSKPGNVTVWGGDRPAAYDKAKYKNAATVAIQFKGKSGGWKTLKKVNVSTSKAGSYFTTSVKLSASGSVRTMITVNKSALYSRTQAVTVK